MYNYSPSQKKYQAVLEAGNNNVKLKKSEVMTELSH